jgi:hypothetical protein
VNAEVRVERNNDTNPVRAAKRTIDEVHSKDGLNITGNETAA